MRERQTIQKLIDEGTVATDPAPRLQRPPRDRAPCRPCCIGWASISSSSGTAIGADGGYGGATVAAVGEFARRNGSTPTASG